MTLLALGLSQQSRVAGASFRMLHWLCLKPSVPVSVRSSNLAMLRQMNGLDRMSHLLCPDFLETGEEVTSNCSF